MMAFRGVDGATRTGRREIVLAGSGGQGLVFLGRLVGRVAAESGLHVVQTQSYGVASRGGFSKSEVVVADASIAYPMVLNPWGILALTDVARNMYAPEVDSEGLLVYDSYGATEGDRSGERGFPFTVEARKADVAESFNILALGTFLALRPVVDPDRVLATLKETGGDLGRRNRRAFSLGLELAR